MTTLAAVAAVANAAPPKPRRGYYILAAILLVVGVGVGLLLTLTKTTAAALPVVDVTVFAILYVLAQSIERVTGLALPALDWIGGRWSPSTGSRVRAKENKRALLLQRRTALRAAAAPDPDEKEKSDAASKELTYVASGFSFALAFIASSYFAFSLLAQIGYSVPGVLATLVTATAIMGGSTGLHELISRIQKAKEESESAT